MQTSSQIAFKEWAVVVDALSRGRQVIILRKGGIIEDNGRFTVDHDRFWLFPTLFHQQMDSVVGAAQTDLASLSAQFQSNQQVQIRFFVQAETVIECSDLARVKSLAGQHVWKESVIEDRFHWGKTNGIHVIVARVFELPHPEMLPMVPAYGGCKSWVELDRPISATGLKPVLSDAEFKAKTDPIVAALHRSAPTQ